MFVGLSFTKLSFGDDSSASVEMLNQLHFVLSLPFIHFYQFRVPLHELYQHDPHLSQGQVFANTAPRSSTKHYRRHLNVFLVFLLLPSFRNELKGFLKGLGVVEKGYPTNIETGPFFDGYSSNFSILICNPFK